MISTMSTLHSAAIAGDINEIQRLIAEGVDVNGCDEATGATPLIAACLNPDTEPAVMELLLDRGADVNAGRKTLDGEPEPLIMLAIKEGASCGKIRLLIEHGADLRYCDKHGYTLLTMAAFRSDPALNELLAASGAPMDGKSSYGESALSVLSRQGRFTEIAQLLAHGADPAPLQWTPLHRAVAMGTLEEVAVLVDAAADMEAIDFWERTAFLLSIQAGDTEKAALLLARGAHLDATGRCGKLATHYPIDRDDARMMQWLVGKGFDLSLKDEFGDSSLHEAIEAGALGCFRILMDAGADWREADRHGDPLLRNATHPEIIGDLIARGQDPAQLEAGPLRDWIGLGTCGSLTVTKEEFVRDRTRRFGKENPERMDIPFWRGMVRCGWAAYKAPDQFDEESCDRENPVWCHERFGMSLTQLEDGRFIQIAGEHEDSYDADFCIYNDVIVHDGKGGFEILGYPQEIFPPTDFHSATLVGPWIYIIGNLGQRHTRDAHSFGTPVYRLHVETYRIERVITPGKSPGWIHKHKAELQDGFIRLSGGKILIRDDDGKDEIKDNRTGYALDLATMAWQQFPGI